MPGLPTVYLVDDQAIVRASLRLWLTQSNRFDVIGQNGDPRAAIGEIRKLQPDLVLLDISMPGLSGLEALPLIIDANPRGSVVMVTDFEDDAFVRQALAGGARGYLSKADEPADLLLGLKRIIEGESYVTTRIPGFGSAT